MLFAVWATDHAGSLATRQQVRERHRARLRDPAGHAVRVLLAGPTRGETSHTMNGTLLVVQADSIDAVRAFVAEDPYMQSGVYAQVDVRPWTCGLGPFEGQP